MITVADHAIIRYRQRVGSGTDEEIVARLSTRFIEAAANFGSRYVRLPSGHRIAIRDHVVITVLPIEWGMKPRWMDQ